MFASKPNPQDGEVAKSAKQRFKANLIALRKERGLTQKRAAEVASLNYKTYQHLELGIRDNPTLEVLEKLARGFGVRIGELVD